MHTPYILHSTLRITYFDDNKKKVGPSDTWSKRVDESHVRDIQSPGNTVMPSPLWGGGCVARPSPGYLVPGW